MDLLKIALHSIFFALVNSSIIKNSEGLHNDTINDSKKEIDSRIDNVFNGVYSECFLHLSYSCLQKKTLLYLKELNNLSEVLVIGDYVKFVRINATNPSDDDEASNTGNTDELAFLIDKAVDDFFDNHVLKFNALGRDISIPRNMEEFVGRKKRKGGGGGGGDMMGGHGGHDDGGKKKMMMMAMMCMKMKLMMMVPAMMGMMGMMSFKGMMFSMMSFMMSKIMLLMKILEKKGSSGGQGWAGSGGGGDGGWPASGGAGGAWMPAGGQDYGSSGSAGGGYDANGQWQSRSITESLNSMNKPTIQYRRFIDDKEKYTKKYSENNDGNKHNLGIQRFGVEHPDFDTTPEISYVKPVVRYNNQIEAEVIKKPILVYKKSNVDFSNYVHEHNNDIDDIKRDDEFNYLDLHPRARRSVTNLKEGQENHNRKYRTETETDFYVKDTTDNSNKNIRKANEATSRKKRSILDLLQNSYMYWMNRILGLNNRRTNFQKHKIINGVRYVFYPFKVQRPKMPKELQHTSAVQAADEFKPVITAEDFNKGEIMEGAIESRMHRKKFHKMKETVNDTMEDDPWQ